MKAAGGWIPGGCTVVDRFDSMTRMTKDKNGRNDFLPTEEKSYGSLSSSAEFL